MGKRFMETSYTVHGKKTNIVLDTERLYLSRQDVGEILNLIKIHSLITLSLDYKLGYINISISDLVK